MNTSCTPCPLGRPVTPTPSTVSGIFHARIVKERVMLELAGALVEVQGWTGGYRERRVHFSEVETIFIQVSTRGCHVRNSK